MAGAAWLIMPLLALGLDALLGDPRGWPHPVRFIGLALDKLEIQARIWAGKPTLAGERKTAFADMESRRLRWAGLAAVVLVAGGSGLLVYIFSSLPGAGWLVALYFAYAGLALHGLIHEVDRARQILRLEGAEAGREAVSRLVSRDVSAAEDDDLYRALAETLAENFNDAVIAPFFWLCLAGPAGLWAYKAVSTMDSMWGYKNERWRDLGRAAARLDDLLAWIPARLSAAFLRFTPTGEKLGAWPGWAIIAGQADAMASPNAGWPMAVAAWLHGRSMGGPTLYHGEMVEKPHLGPAAAPVWDSVSLARLLRHIRRAALAGCLAVWLAWTCVALLIS